MASTRIRALSVIRSLRDDGIDAALFDADEARCDVAVFCKTYRDSDLILASGLKAAGTFIVFDLCDNHFVLGTEVVARLVRMMEIADAWVFSTPALQRVVEARLDFRRPSSVIADAVESSQSQWETNPVKRTLADWQFAAWRKVGGIRSVPIEKRLLWFGNHAGSAADSGMVNLGRLRPELEQCAAAHAATLTVVSDSRSAYQQLTRAWKIPTFYFSWNLCTFLDVLRMHAVVLIPFSGSEFNTVKSNNRLALSLYHGVAVVADSIPSYAEFKDCAFIDDWSGIDRYLSDESLRHGHVEAGRARVAANYLVAEIARHWKVLLGRLRPVGN